MGTGTPLTTMYGKWKNEKNCISPQFLGKEEGIKGGQSLLICLNLGNIWSEIWRWSLSWGKGWRISWKGLVFVRGNEHWSIEIYLS